MSFPTRSEANQAFVYAGCAGVLLVICIICIVVALRCRKRNQIVYDDGNVASHAMTPVAAFPAQFSAASAPSATVGASSSNAPVYAGRATASLPAQPTSHPPGYVQNKVQGDMDQLAQWQAEALAKREMPPLPGQKVKLEYDSDDESRPRVMPGYNLQTYEQAPPLDY